MICAMTNNNALIKLDCSEFAHVSDGVIARLHAMFPIVEMDLSVGEIMVDASSDPDEYSIEMAIVDAVSHFNVDPEALNFTVWFNWIE